MADPSLADDHRGPPLLARDVDEVRGDPDRNHVVGRIGICSVPLRISLTNLLLAPEHCVGVVPRHAVRAVRGGEETTTVCSCRRSEAPRAREHTEVSRRSAADERGARRGDRAPINAHDTFSLQCLECVCRRLVLRTDLR